MAETTALIYGPSKSTKTTQLLFMIREILARNPGKTVRMITGDSGGYGIFKDARLARTEFNPNGPLDILDLKAAPINLIDLVTKLSKGYWPSATGTCVMNEAHATIERDKVAGYVIEGISVLTDMLAKYFGDQTPSADGKVAGYKVPAAFMDGDTTVFGTDKGHVGVMQRLISSWISDFCSLPVDWVLITSHEAATQIKTQGGATNLLPRGPGNAINSAIPAGIQDVFYLTKDVGVAGQPLIALMSTAVDPVTGLVANAGVRMLPELIPYLYRMFPEGKIPLKYDRGINQYYRVKDALLDGLAKGTLPKLD